MTTGDKQPSSDRLGCLAPAATIIIIIVSTAECFVIAATTGCIIAIIMVIFVSRQTSQLWHG